MATTVQIAQDGSATFSFGDGAPIKEAHAPAGSNPDHIQQQLKALREANHAAGHAHAAHAANDTTYHFPTGSAIASAQAPAGADASKVAAQTAALSGLNKMMQVQPHVAAQANASWADRMNTQAANQGLYAGRA
jgi:hypothetical protein